MTESRRWINTTPDASALRQSRSDKELSRAKFPVLEGLRSNTPTPPGGSGSGLGRIHPGKGAFNRWVRPRSAVGLSVFW